MSALLAQARARQAAAPAPTIDAAQEMSERALDALVIDQSRPLGLTLLAWCQAHPVEVGVHTVLVENLRRAIALKQMIHRHVLALWSAIPETVEAGYQVAV